VESCIAPGTKPGLQRSPRHIALVKLQRLIGSNYTRIPCLWVRPPVWTLPSSRKQQEPLAPEIYQLFPHAHRQEDFCSGRIPGHCKEPQREYLSVPEGDSRPFWLPKRFCRPRDLSLTGRPSQPPQAIRSDFQCVRRGQSEVPSPQESQLFVAFDFGFRDEQRAYKRGKCALQMCSQFAKPLRA